MLDDHIKNGNVKLDIRRIELLWSLSEYTYLRRFHMNVIVGFSNCFLQMCIVQTGRQTDGSEPIAMCIIMCVWDNCVHVHMILIMRYHLIYNIIIYYSTTS